MGTQRQFHTLQRAEGVPPPWLTSKVIDDSHGLDNVARVGKGLGDVSLHGAHHAEALLVTWRESSEAQNVTAVLGQTRTSCNQEKKSVLKWTCTLTQHSYHLSALLHTVPGGYLREGLTSQWSTIDRSKGAERLSSGTPIAETPWAGVPSLGRFKLTKSLGVIKHLVKIHLFQLAFDLHFFGGVDL